MRNHQHADQHRHASWQQLLAIFTLAFLLFIAIRWQPEAWIQSLITQQSNQHGFNLIYRDLTLDGLSLSLDHLSIHSNQLSSPIKLDNLNLSPAWSSLLSGHAGAHIHATGYGQQISAIVTQQSDHIDIQSLHAVLDTNALQPLIAKKLPIPVKINGNAQITGNIQLNAINGHPRSGKIQLHWNRAGIDMSSMKMPLGDYTLSLQSADSKQAWQWDLGGGTALKLSGKGNLNTSSNNPSAWSINGMVQAQADQKSANLAALLGNKNKQFRISGKITQPRLDPL